MSNRIYLYVTVLMYLVMCCKIQKGSKETSYNRPFDVISEVDSLQCGDNFSAQIKLNDSLHYDKNSFKVYYRGFPVSIENYNGKISFKTFCGNMKDGVEKLQVVGEVSLLRLKDKQKVTYSFQIPYIVYYEKY